MLSNKLDEEVIQSLIALYKQIDEQIEIAGEEVVQEHTPEYLIKREHIKSYIVNYAQNFIKGLANAENMDVAQIEEYLLANIKNQHY